MFLFWDFICFCFLTCWLFSLEVQTQGFVSCPLLEQLQSVLTHHFTSHSSQWGLGEGQKSKESPEASVGAKSVWIARPPKARSEEPRWQSTLSVTEGAGSTRRTHRGCTSFTQRWVGNQSKEIILGRMPGKGGQRAEDKLGWSPD